MMRILLCSSPGSCRDYFEKALREHAFDVMHIEALPNASELTFTLMDEAIDVLVLEVHGQPKTVDIETTSTGTRAAITNGITSVHRPIIITLCADPRYEDAETRVARLRQGVDACFTAPFCFAEIAARLKALQRLRLKRAPGADKDANTNANANASEASSADLTPRERQLFRCLQRAYPHAVSRDALIDYVWHSERDVSASTLSSTLGRLRSKLRLHARLSPRSWLVETAPHFGYRLVKP